MNKEYIIEVDIQDNEIGPIEKMEAHEKGILHRAFSVFIFNSKKELLLQKRAKTKYHSGGLWTNTCCSHPNFGEDTKSAVKRKLLQEMGIETPTEFQFSFIYRTAFENNLIEHELDHVYAGFSDQEPQLNPEEAEDWKYINMEELKQSIMEFPDKYTVWLQICFNRIYEEWKNL